MTLAQQKAVQAIRDNRLAPQEFLADAIADAFEAFGSNEAEPVTEQVPGENANPDQWQNHQYVTEQVPGENEE